MCETVCCDEQPKKALKNSFISIALIELYIMAPSNFNKLSKQFSQFCYDQNDISNLILQIIQFKKENNEANNIWNATMNMNSLHFVKIIHTNMDFLKTNT